jgi:hypothetical protein
MQVAAVEFGLQFTYNGETYTRDLEGRSGSGEVAVKNVKTGESTRIPAKAQVEVNAEVDKPAVVEQTEEEPSREEMFPDKAPRAGARIPKRELGDAPRETVKPSFKEVDAPPHDGKR